MTTSMTPGMTATQTLRTVYPQIRTAVTDAEEQASVNEETKTGDVEGHEPTADAHPLGVKPSGNALTADHDLSTAMGIFGQIPDALVLLVLEYLDETSLLSLGSTCRGLFAFSSYDQLWRDLCLKKRANFSTWRGSWRASHSKTANKLPQIDCKFLFSDALYRPFQCSNISLSKYTRDIPNQIPKLSDLSPDEFAQKWTHQPFILTEPVKNWPVFEEWDEQQLLANYADTVFRAEAVNWTLRRYFEYMNNNQDESPLYLFDRAFVEKMKLEVAEHGAYEPPECFKEDLFTLLGEHRPDHRWLIIGPERSGSTFHKDPNATSAWNAVIRGSKYWIMFPNSITPPGVYVSEDQSEVTSPLSIAEWLLTFHEEARKTSGCLEGICNEGEVLHVPSGWWHLVVNVDSSIAITQNFVPRSHLNAAVNFLRHKSDQVSGFSDKIRDPHELFINRLKEVHPELYQSLQAAAAPQKRKWEELVTVDEEQRPVNGGFSFGFGDDIE